MIIEYKYTKSGQIYEGQIQTDDAINDSHRLVIAAIQVISDKERERIVFSMLDSTGAREIGVNFVEPVESIQTTEQRVQSIQLSFNGSSWKQIHIITD